MATILIQAGVLAQELDSYYNYGSQFTREVKENEQLTPEIVNKSLLPDYFTQAPPEARITPGELSNTTSTNNEAGRLVVENFGSRPRFEIDRENGPAITNAIGITENPNAVVGNQNCSTVPVKCETTYNKHACEEALHFKEQSCEKNLIVSVYQPAMVSKTIDVFIDAYTLDDTWITVDMKTGKLLSITGDGRDSRLRADIKLSEKLDKKTCPNLKVQNHTRRVVRKPGFATYKVRIAFLQTPACDNNLIARFFMKKKHRGYWANRAAHFTFKVQYQPPKKIKSEYWQNDCASLESNVHSGLCKVIKEECAEGPSTKNISGLNIHKACWKKKLSFECAHAQSQNNCGAYRQRGCEQINSACKERTASGLCAVFEQTFRCATKGCAKETKTICGGKPFCKGGDCSDTRYSPNQDFNKAISHLALLNNSGKDFDESLSQVFKGKTCKCRDVFANFKNCCKDEGWGLDLSLTDCDSEEEALAQKKQQGLCHYVGRYCSEEVLGQCVEKKKSYCCFGSKLARIVHEQGRAQLNLNWGSDKHPNCKGLTPEQLQQLDFSKMDLSGFYDDVKNQATIPNSSQTTNRIKERINQFYREKP